MITTLLRISWLNLKRDRVALGLTFVLPIVFFSIFAMIFGGMGGGGSGTGPSAMRIIAVDEDDSDVSRALIEALDDQDAIDVVTRPAATEDEPDPSPYTRDAATGQVRRGRFPAAVIIPAGFGAEFGSFGGDGRAIDLIHDPSNPLAQHTVAGLLQASAMMAAPDVLMERGLDQLAEFGGPLTEGQKSAVDALTPFLRGDQPWDELDEPDASGADSGSDSSTDPTAGTDPNSDADPDSTEDTEDTDGDGNGAAGFTGLVTVNALSAREAGADADEPRSSDLVSYYAAGIGVMFLLFSMAGAAGTLLEEEQTGTLERLLTSNVGMGTLLAGYWLFFAAVGVVQLTVMFAWGAAVFGLDLLTANHLVGFVAMSLLTSAAAAAFGLFLATLCRSRGQLSGMSTIVILIMSALGGSMVPRFIMPAFMNTTAKFTFNGWALDGYLKVFWYDDPAAGLAGTLASILPQLAALLVMTVVFLGVARMLARRWETV